MPSKRTAVVDVDPDLLRRENARLRDEVARLDELRRDAEQRYHALVAAAEDGICAVDSNHVITYVSDPMATMLGYLPQDLIGRPVVDFVRPEDLPALRSRQRRRRAGISEAVLITLIHKSGSALTVRTVSSPLLDSAGRYAGAIALVTDATPVQAAEQALEESQARLAGIVESAMDAFIAVDADQNVVLFNPAAEQMFGCSAIEALGRPLERFIPTRLQHVHRTHVAHFAATGTTARRMGALGQLSAVRASGEEFPIEASISYTSVSGKDLYTVILRDTSERNVAEVALRESELRYRLLFDGNPLPMWVYDRETFAFLAVNEAAVASYGYSRDEFLAMTLPEVYPRDIRDAVLDAANSSFAGGHDASTWRQQRKDGSVLDAHLVTDDIYWAGHAARLVLANDVTERLRAQRELQVSMANLQALVDSSPLAIVLMDEARTVQMWNAAAERIFGWTRDEIVGRPYPLVPEMKLAEHEATWEALHEGRGLFGLETQRRAKDGTLRDVILYTAPMHDPSTGLTMGLSILADNGERVRLQQQLLQAQKMEGIGRLAGGVAHDFNNLLTAILGYTELAMGHVAKGTVIASHLESVEMAAERAAELTRQLLAFARRQIIEPKIVDLNEVITNIDRLLRRLIGEDIEFITLPTPDLGKVEVDAGQIEQVIVNLAVNARDAMQTGGRLTIETDNVVLGKEYAHQHAEVTPGPYVLLAITDTGTGMSDEVKAHAFEPFFTTKEIGKGTGLGLATCFGIVKQSGGHIWYYSEPGSGTTFKVYLPRVWDDATAPRADIVEDAPLGGETILLVEDEPMVRDMAADALRALGYTVKTARTGVESMEIVAGHRGRIDLLITDVVMPHLSGKQVAQQLTEADPKLRVLYMSGYTHDSIVHHGVLDAGIDFIAKPFTPAALARKVRSMLDAPET